MNCPAAPHRPVQRAAAKEIKQDNGVQVAVPSPENQLQQDKNGFFTGVRTDEIPKGISLSQIYAWQAGGNASNRHGVRYKYAGVMNIDVDIAE